MDFVSASAALPLMMEYMDELKRIISTEDPKRMETFEENRVKIMSLMGAEEASLAEEASRAGEAGEAAEPRSLDAVLSNWRIRERRRVAHSVDELMKYGMVHVNCTSREDKRRHWPKLLEALVEVWRKEVPGFEMTDHSTWPRGYCKGTALTEKVEGALRLVTDNYDVQSIACALFDPELQRFHFGAQSHWKLRLLVNLRWALCPWVEACKDTTCSLHGCDEAWHLTSWPTATGASVKRKTHIDGGQNNIFVRNGVPCKADDMHRFAEPDMRLLYMNMFQSLILFYCDTPGDLAAPQGATAVHPLSHVIVMGALSKLAREGRTSMNILEGMKMWGKRVQHNKENGGPGMLRPSYLETEGILLLGSLAHTTAPALEPMYGGMPRVIQNCKIHAAFDYFPNKNQPDLQEHFLSLIAPSSMLARMCRDPLQTYLEVCGSGDQGEENVRYIQQETEALYTELSKNPPQST
jgi:hypothetical protein